MLREKVLRAQMELAVLTAMVYQLTCLGGSTSALLPDSFSSAALCNRETYLDDEVAPNDSIVPAWFSPISRRDLPH